MQGIHWASRDSRGGSYRDALVSQRITQHNTGARGGRGNKPVPEWLAHSLAPGNKPRNQKPTPGMRPISPPSSMPCRCAQLLQAPQAYGGAQVESDVKPHWQDTYFLGVFLERGGRRLCGVAHAELSRTSVAALAPHARVAGGGARLCCAYFTRLESQLET